MRVICTILIAGAIGFASAFAAALVAESQEARHDLLMQETRVLTGGARS